MNYQVIWPEFVRDRLIAFYEIAVRGSGTETAALNGALAAIEDALGRTPIEAGESREGNRRVIIVPPLAVEFTIDSSERRVVVEFARYSPRPRR
jgi:hypothetical protein